MYQGAWGSGVESSNCFRRVFPKYTGGYCSRKILLLVLTRDTEAPKRMKVTTLFGLQCQKTLKYI